MLITTKYYTTNTKSIVQEDEGGMSERFVNPLAHP